MPWVYRQKTIQFPRFERSPGIGRCMKVGEMGMKDRGNRTHSIPTPKTAQSPTLFLLSIFNPHNTGIGNPTVITSLAVLIPALNAWIRRWCGTHLPLTLGSHALANGRHWHHGKMNMVV